MSLIWLRYQKHLKTHSGHIIAVDIHFYFELHDKIQEYPSAPETLTAELEWLSVYQKEIGQRTGTLHHNKFNGFDKLVHHCCDHYKSAIHHKVECI